jgi:hypothetical protein
MADFSNEEKKMRWTWRKTNTIKLRWTLMKRRNQNMEDLTNKRQNEIEVDFDEKTQPKCKTLWTLLLVCFGFMLSSWRGYALPDTFRASLRSGQLPQRSPPLTQTTVPTKIGNKASIFSVLTRRLRAITCPEIFRDNSCLSYRKGKLKISSIGRGHHRLSPCFFLILWIISSHRICVPHRKE